MDLSEAGQKSRELITPPESPIPNFDRESYSKSRHHNLNEDMEVAFLRFECTALRQFLLPAGIMN